MKTPAPSRRDRIRSRLADLKMPGALEALDQVLSKVDGAKLGAAEAIEALLGAQINLRNNRRLQAAMRSSRLPAVKMLADVDFSFQPSVKREQLASLHELGFLERRENVIFLGPPGVGKTHPANSLAIAAAQHGRRVYYGIDRLLYHCHIVNIRGNSYRTRHHSELWHTLNSPDTQREETPRKTRKRKENAVPAG